MSGTPDEAYEREHRSREQATVLKDLLDEMRLYAGRHHIQEDPAYTEARMVVEKAYVDLREEGASGLEKAGGALKGIGK